MSHPRQLPVVLCLLWALAVAAGYSFLIDFDVTPGGAGDPPAIWPAGSAIVRAAGRPELMMMVHPHCPCSRASLAELERIMARCRGSLSVHLLLVTPAGAGPGWADTEMRRRAERIPGVTVVDDSGGLEAQRFNIETSGHALLYDSDGTLRFSGGITLSRGHQGDNAGSRSILSFRDKRATARVSTAVFGCPLRGSCRM